MNELFTTLAVIAGSLPVIIVWVIGITLALSRWRLHPQVSQFALIAFVVMIVLTVANRTLNLWLPLMMHDRGTEPGQIRQISIAIAMVTQLVSAAAWAMALCAVFGWRDGRQKRDFPKPPQTFADEPREQTQRYEFRNNQ
jgi:hypothetical protein